MSPIDTQNDMEMMDVITPGYRVNKSRAIQEIKNSQMAVIVKIIILVSCLVFIIYFLAFPIKYLIVSILLS